MPQRGRKSSAALDVPAPDGTPPPLRPPASLNKTEAKIFVDLVEAADKKHFRASDAPLLAAYARAIRFESYAAAALRGSHRYKSDEPVGKILPRHGGA